MATDEIHFRRRLFLPAARPLGKETWQPWADVYRVPGGWLVKLELAGRLAAAGAARQNLVPDRHGSPEVSMKPKPDTRQFT